MHLKFVWGSQRVTREQRSPTASREADGIPGDDRFPTAATMDDVDASAERLRAWEEHQEPHDIVGLFTRMVKTLITTRPNTPYETMKTELEYSAVADHPTANPPSTLSLEEAAAFSDSWNAYADANELRFAFAEMTRSLSLEQPAAPVAHLVGVLSSLDERFRAQHCSGRALLEDAIRRVAAGQLRRGGVADVSAACVRCARKGVACEGSLGDDGLIGLLQTVQGCPARVRALDLRGTRVTARGIAEHLAPFVCGDTSASCFFGNGTWTARPLRHIDCRTLPGLASADDALLGAWPLRSDGNHPDLDRRGKGPWCELDCRGAKGLRADTIARLRNQPPAVAAADPRVLSQAVAAERGEERAPGAPAVFTQTPAARAARAAAFLAVQVYISLYFLLVATMTCR